MTIEFSCPGCGKGYSLPERFAGKRATCKKCDSRFAVPSPSEDFVQLTEKDLELTDDDLEVLPDKPDLFDSLSPVSPAGQTSQANGVAAPAAGFGALAGAGGGPRPARGLGVPYKAPAKSAGVPKMVWIGVGGGGALVLLIVVVVVMLSSGGGRR